jgi:hypothetical protein
MSENRQIPWGESWTCTYGECCTDERCERWTWRLSVVSVLALFVAGVIAVVLAVV